MHDRAQHAENAEERAGDGLGRAVARQKGIVAHPSPWHDLGAQKWQHDMATAEYQRARAVEAVEEGKCFRFDCRSEYRQRDKKGKKDNQAGSGG